MRVDKRLSPDESNLRIKNLIESGIPFSVTRVGLGGETAVSALTLSGQNIPENVRSWFYINAGFYGTDNLIDYSNMYKRALENSDLVAYWNFPGFIEMEDFLVPENKELIDISALESFRFNDPRTKMLSNKKVLVINPFKDTIDSQLNNKKRVLIISKRILS